MRKFLKLTLSLAVLFVLAVSTMSFMESAEVSTSTELLKVETVKTLAKADIDYHWDAMVLSVEKQGMELKGTYWDAENQVWQFSILDSNGNALLNSVTPDECLSCPDDCCTTIISGCCGGFMNWVVYSCCPPPDIKE